ncbi:hypothetical protein AKJ52_01175 [candidate division MSBL1 archaeon SCGC-AAA382C18]|uniref:Glycosyl transferase family 1 domain-containing protein n=1 Tax=candidate division MSBL1 archaeon SCGC-AAA382C18 TaxID=1698281 RepID=A0A133VKM5_9EURY|nr:hypothetical protein AKJ52_01175 [candidate division MSBL1 archaeon SCGC-AAA382C18]
MQGIRLYIYNYPKEWVYRYVDDIYDRLASRKLEKCDIFHGWNNHSLKSLKKAKNLGAKTVVERASAHPDIQKKILTEEHKKYGKKIPSFPSYKRSCKELEKCDYITVPSDFAEKSFLKKGYSEEKIIKIPFGADLSRYKPKENRNSNKFTVIFVGAVTLQKGIQYLLNAWDSLKLKDSELLICGSVHNEVKDIVQKYREDRTIRFLGHVEKVPYHKADVFVLPSLHEGSASVTYEAMASGLPVIVSDNTGSVARAEKDGFIIPIRKPEILADKIRYFYENPSEIKKQGKNARKRVERYSWSRYEERLIDFYEKIVN